MADNARPALYGARYTVAAAGRLGEPADERVSLAGRHCESGDVLADDAELPPVVPGDLVAFAATGAYTPVDGLDLQRDRRGSPPCSWRTARRA